MSDEDPRVKAFESRPRARRSSQPAYFPFRVVLEQLASYTLFCGATMVVAPYFAPMYRDWGTIFSKLAAVAILFNLVFADHWALASLAWVGLTAAIISVDRSQGRAAAQKLLRRSSYAVVAAIALDLAASVVIPGCEWMYVADSL